MRKYASFQRRVVYSTYEYLKNKTVSSLTDGTANEAKKIEEKRSKDQSKCCRSNQYYKR